MLARKSYGSDKILKSWDSFSFMGIILRLIFTFRKVIKVSFHPFLTPLDFNFAQADGTGHDPIYFPLIDRNF